MAVYRSYRSSLNLNHIWTLVALNFIVFAVVRLLDLTGASTLNELAQRLAFSWPSLFTSPWTILTSIFTHFGLWHIFANMLTLYFFGSTLTRLVGMNKMLIIYFAGGIFANLVFILIERFTLVIGASGAIFAVAGTLVVLVPKMRVVIFPIPVPMPLWVAILVIGVVLSFIPGVAWQAHLGGLVFGLAAGLILRKRTTLIY
jgi:membrane associated rhomboid family serine protease